MHPPYSASPLVSVPDLWFWCAERERTCRHDDEKQTASRLHCARVSVLCARSLSLRDGWGTDDRFSRLGQGGCDRRVAQRFVAISQSVYVGDRGRQTDLILTDGN